MQIRPTEEPPIFKEKEIIDDNFLVLKRLGRGGYGEIYEAQDQTNGQRIAVKVERIQKPGNLIEEEKILRDLNEQEATFIPKLISSGRHQDSVNYIVLELLGDNLSNLCRQQSNHRFSLSTTLKLGMYMLKAIQEVHDLGYLHRDIKPGNFVLGYNENGIDRTVILIDFGLSRRHLSSSGDVKPKRKTARWVGSRRYMSVNTHLRKDQGRRDDLWSFLYVLVEFVTGTLPWAHLRGLEHLDNIRDLKQMYNNEKLVRGLPDEFLRFLHHIQGLKYEDKPNYDLLFGLMLDLYESSGGNVDTRFDWEIKKLHTHSIGSLKSVVSRNLSDNLMGSPKIKNKGQEHSLDGVKKRVTIGGAEFSHIRSSNGKSVNAIERDFANSKDDSHLHKKKQKKKKKCEIM